MAFGLGLVEDRLVGHEVLERHVHVGVELRAAGLVLLVVELGVDAAHADEPRRQVEPTTLPGDLVQPCQGQFDLRMAVRAMDLAGRVAEVAVDAVGGAFGDVQGAGGAGGLVMRHGRLDEVAHRVQFVAPTQALEPLVGRQVDLELGVEVAVLVLQILEQPDGLVHLGLDVVDVEALVAHPQRVAGGLQPFGHVGVLEGLAAERPGLAPGGDAQVAQGAAELAAVLTPGGALGHVHRRLVVQRTPLVGQRVVHGHRPIAVPEPRGDRHLGARGLIGHDLSCLS